jgi:hypothetical protein
MVDPVKKKRKRKKPPETPAAPAGDGRLEKKPDGDAKFVMGRLATEWEHLQYYMGEQEYCSVEPLDFTWGEEALPYKYRFTFKKPTLGRPNKKTFRSKAYPLDHFPIKDEVSFDIYLSEAYPVVKPEIYAVSEVWHPNIHPGDGFVCYVNDKTWDLTVHLSDVAEMLLGVLSWEDINENPDDFYRRVETGDYLNPDAAAWAYNHADEIDSFRMFYYTKGGISFDMEEDAAGE